MKIIKNVKLIVINSLQYFTIWGLIFHIFLIILGINYINKGILVASNLLVINNSIIGTFIMNKYKKKWIIHTNMPSYMVFMSDFITHIIPLIYILFSYKIFIENFNDFYYFILTLIIFPSIYLTFHNPANVYRATNWSLEKFFVYSYILLFINLIGFQYYNILSLNN